MFFKLMELPYSIDALEPHMSARTFSFHYGKHHKTYVDNLNNLIKGTKFEAITLDEIIKESAGKPEFAGIFNNAAQVWNHNFFWNSMSPKGGGKPTGAILTRIERDFGSYEKFRENFKATALSQFGSGWAWLVEKDGKLSIMKTSNADNPIIYSAKPIIVIDVWEHSYYLDYQNLRGDYIDAYLDHLVKW